MGKFGEELIKAMEQALAHARGEPVPGSVVYRVTVLDDPPDEPDPTTPAAELEALPEADTAADDDPGRA